MLLIINGIFYFCGVWFFGGLQSNTDEDFWNNAVRETTKRKSVHLKLQEKDVQKIRTIAYKKGIPYQTLIGSIIHQYAQGYS